ncbi:TrmB family transcriptional regulator [Salinirubrum litoreum]|uniref:TrmB family transcriptional regulator n=1 Tax=Salinirubrum litoreum TaxID=1126234 RepID=A0ABD5R9H6_9EURY
MSQHEAVEALERLGLSNYEARVFVALQRLGTGTAKEVHSVADVPRSQVYGAAEELEERGLIEIQRSTPKRYRPVSIETAKAQLRARLEREQERAFTCLDEIQRSGGDVESRDDVWTVRGTEPVTDRLVDLAERAESELFFGAASPELVPDHLVETLRRQAEAGLSVRVVSESAEVRDLFAGTENVTVEQPVEEAPRGFTSRFLLVDDSAILLSVVTGDGGQVPGTAEETAIWSADTAIAAVLSLFIRYGVDAILG